MASNPDFVPLELRGISKIQPILDGQEAVEDAVRDTQAVANRAADDAEARAKDEAYVLEILEQQWRATGRAADATGDQSAAGLGAATARARELEAQLAEIRRELDAIGEEGRRVRDAPVAPVVAPPSSAAAPGSSAGGPATELDAVGVAAAKAEEQSKKAFDAIGKSSRAAGREVFAARERVLALEQAIQEVQRAGGPIRQSDLDRLAAARVKVKQLDDEFAKFSARQKDFADDARAGQAALAGEIGSVNSLQDLLRLGGAKWADYGAQAFAAIGAFQVGREIGGGLRTTLNAISEELGFGADGFDRFFQSFTGIGAVADGLVNFRQRLDESIAGVTGLTTASDHFYEANLRNILIAKGIDVVGLSVDQLAEKYREMQQAGQGALLLTQAIAVEGKALGDALEGDAAAIAKRTAVIKEAVAVIEQDGKVSAATARDLIKAIDEQQEALLRNGQKTDPVLAKQRERLLGIVDAANAAAAAAKHLAERDERVGQIAAGLIKLYEGEEGALRERTAGTLAAIEAVRLDGEVSAQAAAEIVKDIESQLAAYRKLGVEAPADLAKLRDEFREIADEARTAEGAVSDLSDAVRQKMGLQAPADIRKGADALAEYSAEARKSGDITKEQAEKIAGGWHQILEQVAVLPDAERDALADVVALAQKGQDAYREMSEQRKSFAASAAEEEKRLAEEVAKHEAELLKQRTEQQRAYVDSLADAVNEIASALPAPEADSGGVQELQKSLADLQKIQEEGGELTTEQLAQMFELEQKVKDAGGAVTGLTDDFRELNDAQREQVVGAEVVNGALASVVQTIREQSDAYRALPQAVRESLENQVSAIQATAEAGGASSLFLENSFRSLSGELRGAGFEVGALDDALASFGESGGDLGKELSKIGEGFDEFGPKAEAAAKGLTTMKDEAEGVRREATRINAQLTRTIVLLDAVGKKSIQSI